MNNVIKIKKLNEDAIIPKYQTTGAAGFDLHSVEEVTITPGNQKMICIGIAVEIPLNTELQIRPRSGLAASNMLSITNSPGTLDSDYRGEIKVILINHDIKSFKVMKGDRIAQAVLSPVIQGDIIEVEELSETVRGVGGHGSTGK